MDAMWVTFMVIGCGAGAISGFITSSSLPIYLRGLCTLLGAAIGGSMAHMEGAAFAAAVDVRGSNIQNV
jgi:hypothetical protein